MSINNRDTTTYILITQKGEYYAGKTKNIKKRLETHKKELERFSMKNVKRYFESCEARRVSPS
jgi:predicted GIY-YIG superfamily endonuclease